jgi:pimeloyl-ACP methyl ester carboxylesterase
MIVPVPGAELFYSTRGTGSPCIVPCILGTKQYERLTPAPLTDLFQFIYVDLRGGGQSTGDPGTLTFDVSASDLEAIRTHLGLERVAVLGYSILGVLAIEYGRRCPGSVSHVIAAGTPPIGDIGQMVKAATAFFEAEGSEERKAILRALHRNRLCSHRRRCASSIRGSTQLRCLPRPISSLGCSDTFSVR